MGQYDPNWDLCDCGAALEYCEDCDNEVCSECSRGCSCTDDEEGDEIDVDSDDYLYYQDKITLEDYLYYYDKFDLDDEDSNDEDCERYDHYKEVNSIDNEDDMDDDDLEDSDTEDYAYSSAPDHTTLHVDLDNDVPAKTIEFVPPPERVEYTPPERVECRVPEPEVSRPNLTEEQVFFRIMLLFFSGTFVVIWMLWSFPWAIAMLAPMVATLFIKSINSVITVTVWAILAFYGVFIPNLVVEPLGTLKFSQIFILSIFIYNLIGLGYVAIYTDYLIIFIRYIEKNNRRYIDLCSSKVLQFLSFLLRFAASFTSCMINAFLSKSRRSGRSQANRRKDLPPSE